MNGRIFLLWISVSSYVRWMVPHMPPARSIGYWLTIAFGNVDEVLIDGADGGPILIFSFDQARFQIGDDGMAAVLADEMADFLGFGAVDEVLLEALDDLAHVLVEGVLGTVVINEVFDDVAWELVHACVDGEGLIDDLAFEGFFKLEVHQIFICCWLDDLVAFATPARSKARTQTS